jgi:CRP-like cAMP-binding protein
MKIKLMAYKSPENDFPPMLKKFNFIDALAPEEINALMRLHEHTFSIDERKIILEQGDIRKKSFIVTQGWAYRFSSLFDGSQQVINYYLPGDVISPFALVMPKASYSVASISRLEVCVFNPDYLLELFSTQPKIGIYYGWMLGRQDASMAEQIVRIGRLSAYKRTAHLLMEFYHRLKVVELVDNNTFYLPMTQQLLADTLGLSIVHMNRTLKKLQKDNLISLSGNKLCFLNPEKIKQVAEYDTYYLDEIRHFISGDIRLDSVPISADFERIIF